MAKPLFLPITPILLLACHCRSHGLRFVYMYQQYMRRRRRKQLHCGFAGGIQALRAHVVELLILPKWNLKRKDFERFNQIFVYVPGIISALLAAFKYFGHNPKGKQPTHSNISSGKKRKVEFLDRATDAILEFTETSRKMCSDKESESRKIVESALMHDLFSMAKAVDIVNFIRDVNDYTLFKVLEKFHEPESKAAFITLNPER